MKPVILLILVSLILTGPASATAQSLDPNDLKKLKLLTFSPPDKAPSFTLKNLDGEDVKLTSFHGKPLLVYFWATW